MKEAFLPPHGPTPLSSSLSMAIALGALSMEEAEKMAKEGVMERPENEQIFDRGCLAAQFGRYEEAATLFTELLGQEPDNRAARYNRGLACLHLNRYDEARIDIDEIIGKEAGNAKAWCNRAHLFLAAMEIRPAQEAARRALTLDNRSRAAAINLGHSLIYHLSRMEAEEAYRRAFADDATDAHRDGVMLAVRRDVADFRDAGWPAEKLKELMALFRRVELDPFDRKEKLPAADGSDGFIGANLELLRARTDFFNWFHLEPVGEGKLEVESVTTEFKPSWPAFHELVTLRVVTDRESCVESLRLEIARKFVDDPRDGIFACDLAKSFLRNAAAPADRPALNEIAAELETNARTVRPRIVADQKRQEFRRPDRVSPPCSVFFGFGQRWEKRFESRRLRVAHDGGDEKVWIEMMC